MAEPFVSLFRTFLGAYLEETRDEELWDVIPPFLAFRALVIGHPMVEMPALERVMPLLPVIVLPPEPA